MMRLLIVTFLFSFTQFVVGANSQEEVIFANLLDWLEKVGEEEENIQQSQKRLFKNKNIELRTDENGVRGVYSSNNIDEEVSSFALAIPQMSLMSASSATDEIRSNPLANILQKDKFQQISSLTILVAHLQCELSKESDSWWWPYLATLPQSSSEISQISAMLWDDREFLSLSPTLFEHVITMRKKRDEEKKIVKKMFSKILKVGCGGNGWGVEGNGWGVEGGNSFNQAFDESYAIVLSHSANLHGITQQRKYSSQFESESESEGSVVLTPLLDLLNHKRGGARYVELYSKRNINDDDENDESSTFVFGVGIQSPPNGFEKGQEIFHDYEGTTDEGGTTEWWNQHHHPSPTAPPTSTTCDYEFLTNYGFLPDMEFGSSCIILPWIGIVKGYDVINELSPILEVCQHKEQEEQHEQEQQQDQEGDMKGKMSKALRWEIDHDYHQVKNILSAQTSIINKDASGGGGGGSREDDEEEDVNACSLEDAEDGWCEIVKKDDVEDDVDVEVRLEDLESKRRLMQVLHLTQGELRILEHLQKECNGGGVEEINLLKAIPKKSFNKNKKYKKKKK